MYRIFGHKIFTLILGLIGLFILSACVPKATEKNAVCGANEAFNSVTRTCYSVAEVRYKPVATYNGTTLSQETGSLVTLTYTDQNADTATACSVSSVSPNLQMFSPVIADGTLETKASDLQLAMYDLKVAFDQYVIAFPSTATLTAQTNINTYYAAVLSNKNKIVSSYYIATIESEGVAIQGNSTNQLAQVSPYTSNNTLNYYYGLAQTRLTEFNTYYASLANKCLCTGGVCKTYVLPKKDFSGSAGFSYTVTDVDGVSDAKSATFTVTAYSKAANHYKPTVESVYTSGTESYTTTPGTYAFTLGTARDYFSTTTFNYSHGKTVQTGVIPGYSATAITYVNSDNNLGKVTACLGLGGASATDTSCIYIPNDGNAYDALTPAAATVTLADIVLTAKANGTAGNSISVQYVDIASDLTSIDPYAQEMSKFGYVSATELFIRVINNRIYVIFNSGYTKTSDIVTAINNDALARSLVTASGGSSTNASISTASTAQSLAGGVDGYDTFTYYAANAYATSVNVAKAAIHITAVTDYPEINYATTRSVTYAEKTPSNGNANATIPIDLSATYTAVDGAISCTITDTNIPLLYLSASAPTCTCAANICTATVYPMTNVSGSAPFTFSYSICSASGCTSAVTYNVYLTPVNDQPSISGLLATDSMNENSTATPTSYSKTLTLDPGGAGFESSQTITLTATSSNTTVVPNANIVFTGTGTTRTMTITPTLNQSAVTPVTITVVATDNGGTTGCTVTFSGDTCNKKTYTFDLTINPTNDPPYFISSISSTESNEGGYVIVGPFKVDEDQADSADENADSIKVTVTSDNQAVLMNSGIRIFYDLNDNGIEDSSPVNEYRASGAALETTASDDSNDHSFYLKLTPVGGTSGSANVTVSVVDGTAVASPAQPASKTFSFVVNPVAAQHGGWSNISAVGLKTDKYGAPANVNDVVCNYNKSTDNNKCTIRKFNSSNNTWTSTPNSNCTEDAAPFLSSSFEAVPTAANVLYWDKSNKKCYYSYASGSTFAWKQLTTSCPITRSASICSGENCLNNGVLATAPTAVNQYYYNLTAGTCHKSVQSGSTFSWDTIPYYPAKVTLSWKNFTLSGSGTDIMASITGYNVYRREAGTDYDYKAGFLKINSSDTKSVSSSSTLTFTDTTAQAGKTYYYTVRPIDSRHNFATYTPEVYSEVRLVAPPRNMAFVHRWMINQEMCNKMHMTTATTEKVDPSRNFRCPYYGPGNNLGYYDYGSDLLVDLAEIGCPYTLDTNGTHCTNGSSGCIGIGVPDVDVSLANSQDKDIYYDRSSGKCYINNGGGTTWVEMDNATSPLFTGAITASLDPYNTSLNPPITNVKQASAANLCTYRPAPTIYKNPTTTMAGLTTMSLPEKKDYMAYSAAPITMNGSTLSDSQIADIEQGDSLNVQSRCNGSQASGLASYYSDSTLPTSSYIFTLPGTASSNIRSLYTGSVPWGYNYGTENCVSRYGVQDVYGNVAEWTKDKMTCDTSTYVCAASSGTSLYYDFYDGTTGNAYDSIYAFDLIIGPHNDSNGSGVGGDTFSGLTDSFLTEWDLADENFDATKFNFALGMPLYTNMLDVVGCNYTKYSAGTCRNGNLGCVGSGDPSGVSLTGVVNGNVYLDLSSKKCYTRAGGVWGETAFSTPTAAGRNYVLDIGSSSGITYAELHGDGMIVNGQDVYGADASHQGGLVVGGSYLSGARSGRYTTELLSITNKSPDVGFRCIMPIDKTKYDTTDPFHSYSY